MKFLRAIYWMLVGSWLTVVAALFYDRSHGGGMPVADMMGMALPLVALVAHKLLDYWEISK